jgi:hypothetical protein
MTPKLVIGIGGLARSGKDTLCNLLIQALYLQGVKAKRRALADELKLALRPILLEKYNIDVLNCTPQEKEQIRPDLVEFGKVKRLASQGTYWTSILDEKMKSDEEQVIIVPDIRYHHYPQDEVNWVKDKNAGILIHVARYTFEGDKKIYVQPPNEDEREHDPRVRANADFCLAWPTKDIAGLQEDFGGFFQTIALLTGHELQNINRRTTGS